jgi:putative transcriptional regulator
MRGEAKPSRHFIIKDVDVKLLRSKLGLSQSKFSALLGVSVKTLQNWEQGRRKPQGPAKALLAIVKSHPEVIFDSMPLQV